MPRWRTPRGHHATLSSRGQAVRRLADGRLSLVCNCGRNGGHRCDAVECSATESVDASVARAPRQDFVRVVHLAFAGDCADLQVWLVPAAECVDQFVCLAPDDGAGGNLVSMDRKAIPALERSVRARGSTTGFRIDASLTPFPARPTIPALPPVFCKAGCYKMCEADFELPFITCTPAGEV